MAIIPTFKVSDFLAVVNQSLDMAFGVVEVEGEVASFKVNHQKYVFFDLKDDTGSVGCFMTVWQMRSPIEDGMKVVVRAVPKVTQWGKFSLTISEIRPIGEGSLKKSFELLKAKLDKEGLFDEVRKRSLPEMPSLVAVISSTGAAGYADFMKIAGQRFGGVKFAVANVQVQGMESPKQIVRAIEYFNQLAELPEVIVIVRGGGSADDLATFNDEPLVRAIVSSRVPILTGIGHETDESLSDLAADKAAVTPTNAAQILLPDKAVLIDNIDRKLRLASAHIEQVIEQSQSDIDKIMTSGFRSVQERMTEAEQQLKHMEQMLRVVDPRAVLERGYALVRGEMEVGGVLDVETKQAFIKAEVKEYHEK